MTTDRDAVRAFFRKHAATAVGPTPVQPNVTPGDDGDEPDAIERGFEMPEADWKAVVVSEAPARDGEFPVRFIDGSQAGQPVVCVRTAEGWPIPLLISEVGAVALKSVGRRFEREFVAVERVLSFVADPFPWEEVEAFAAALVNIPELKLRVLPANRPQEQHSPFDYEIMRTQARARAQQEMTTLERLALAVNRKVPTLVDGPLHRLMGSPDPFGPLLIGVVKTQAADYLHPKGWQTLLDLKPGQRTPVFQYEGRQTAGGSVPVASWYLKLAGGPQLAPNWGYVRVEVPWGQFQHQFRGDFGFVNRLSRWLIDARCRTDSYARMPVSLDPIVRAEDALKPLFTPLQVLVNRLYRQAGFFRRNEL
ncbi:hypothetical protein [Limnoglobus roseus]|uniref:NurA domain-containing protein n=1 Tax=Limnoglobus roseus TaxID=2598579 RepID=A0A5C1A9E0_9BACT|nr:hypothetical protein [Limnoglobus roseus]QEL15340.1 hypothetical protein PX52LOC_02255 [Limnoglobus roseus]